MRRIYESSFKYFKRFLVIWYRATLVHDDEKSLLKYQLHSNEITSISETRPHLLKMEVTKLCPVYKHANHMDAKQMIMLHKMVPFPNPIRFYKYVYIH